MSEEQKASTMIAIRDKSRQHKRMGPKQLAFLKAYAECGTVTHAALAAGVTRQQHYVWLKDDPDYAEDFETAHLAACEFLEREARKRATEGLRKYKFDSDGQPLLHPVTGEPYYEHVLSDVLLIFLLKGAMPQKYRDNVSVETSEKPVIVEDEKWYGNEAHAKAADHAAEAAPAPDVDSPE